VAEASRAPGGAEAIQLKVAQQYIEEFGKVISNADTIILPSNLSRAGMITNGDERGADPVTQDEEGGENGRLAAILSVVVLSACSIWCNPTRHGRARAEASSPAAA
jgi:hypothetical protein